MKVVDPPPKSILGKRTKNVENGGPAKKKHAVPVPPTFIPSFVGFHNIGQGSSTALYDNNGFPIVYFDFGFPLTFYYRTAPANALAVAAAAAAGAPLVLQRDIRNPRACLCNTQLIILSHWDWDHWYQGHHNLNNMLATGIPVIAPVQPVAGQAFNFWNGLAIAQRQVWPAGHVHRAFNWGFLEHCTGPAGNPNRSGLVALVRVAHDPAAIYPPHPVLGTAVANPIFHPGEEYVLLMGDGEFAEVPTIQAANAVPAAAWTANLNIVGIGASHHGANLHVAPPLIPLAPGGAGGRIVYSYGKRQLAPGAPGCHHCYTHHGAHEGHPRAAAVAQYNAQGWTHRMDTADCQHPPAPPPVQTNSNFAIAAPGAPVPPLLVSCQVAPAAGCNNVCRLRNFQT